MKQLKRIYVFNTLYVYNINGNKKKSNIWSFDPDLESDT